MNKTITSQEAILSVAKEIVLEIGLQGLNIRDVAKKCGVSVGSIYNYFPTKGDLTIATIEAVWKDIMHGYKIYEDQHNFVDNIQRLFTTIQRGSENYPSFFSVHAMSVVADDKTKGRESMDQYFVYMKKGLLATLQVDQNIRSDAFSESFTKEEFIDFIFSSLMSLLMKRANSCDFLIEAIRRMIYK
ncbi:MAG: TetR/AcrR family transcriptional regulator [Cellulosilyticaceae bacterium]